MRLIDIDRKRLKEVLNPEKCSLQSNETEKAAKFRFQKLKR